MPESQHDIDIKSLSKKIFKSTERMSRNQISDEYYEKYRDLSWLMPVVDVPLVLKKLSLPNAGTACKGEWVYSFCPDHAIFTGRNPSHPKWVVNIKNGKTFCFTEGRGSNLFYVVSRILSQGKAEPIPADDVVRFLVDADDNSNIDDIISIGIVNKVKSIRDSLESRESASKSNKMNMSDFDDVEFCLSNRFTPKKLYDFFINPSGKKPTNIRKETVDHFKVYLKTSGFYADRAIIPYFLDNKVFSFAAIDILGKDIWLQYNPKIYDKKSGSWRDTTESDYRKTRFPEGVSMKEYLFGYDDVQECAESLILVEGARERMKLWQEGFPNTLAINGSHFGNEKLLLLSKKAPDEIVIMLDGDKAGNDASMKIKALLSNVFSNVHVANPGDGLDPKNLSHDEISECIKSARKSSVN